MKILVIQTAFTGDAILATSVLEELHTAIPHAELHLLVRKGNDQLFKDHPYVKHVLVWNKQENKWSNWLRTLKRIRSERYDTVINLQRFASTGLLTVLSGADTTIGFDKNPFSFLFDQAVKHEVKSGTHEVDRNHALTASITDSYRKTPRLYPSLADFEAVAAYSSSEYVCMAPGSVWATKMWPEERWCDLIDLTSNRFPERKIYLLGSPSEHALCERIRLKSAYDKVENLSGKLSLLASAALMSKASMNYVNDSAPMHMASAMDAPVTAIYCSTSPSFGFGPLSDKSRIVEIDSELDCRPCGLHGKKSCPLGHFKCGFGISAGQVI